MNFLKLIAKIITKFNEIVAKAASYLIFPIIAVVCIEVFIRYVLKHPSPYSQDLIWMCYGTLIFLGGAYALAEDVHVKADIFYNMMKRPLQLLVNVVCYPLFFFTAMAAFLYSTRKLMMNAWIYAEISRVTSWGPPTAPVKTILFISFVMLTLQGIVKFIQMFKKQSEGGEAS